MFHTKAPKGPQGIDLPTVSRPPTAEETIIRTVEQKTADALAAYKADIEKWATEYIDGLRSLHDFDRLKGVLDSGGSIRRIVLKRTYGAQANIHPEVRLLWGGYSQDDIRFPDLSSADAYQIIIIVEPITAPTVKP